MHALVVDEVNVARDLVLLSSLVKITANGVIKRMGIFLNSKDVSCECTVDQLFAQRKLTAKRPRYSCCRKSQNA